MKLFIFEKTDYGFELKTRNDGHNIKHAADIFRL